MRKVASEHAGLWARRYPPLLVMIVVLVLAVFTLPSALNLPQANPGQSVEYAPVPGNNSGLAQGNLAALGLGSSNAAPGGALQPPPPPPPSNTSANPSTKQCVGSPPRQTEDPLSPPCVAFFNGDDGGATYRGVTGSEVRVLFYLDGGASIITSEGTSTEPTNTYVDLAQPPGANEHVFVHILRTWQDYFNQRYQAYGRRVHFYVYFSNSNNSWSPQARRADAADNLQHVDPFAVVSWLYYPNGEADYLSAIAAHGVLAFGSTTERPASFASAFPGQIWSYWPSTDEHAKVFGDYVCRKVIPYAASFSGNSGENHNPRRLGFVYSASAAYPELQAFADSVKQAVQACGGRILDQYGIPGIPGDYAGDAQNDTSSDTQAMATFKNDRISTVIWAGGADPGLTQAASKLNYEPEWVLSDPMRRLEANDFGQNEAGTDQSEWSHAVVVTPVTLAEHPAQTVCHQAYRQTDGSGSLSDDDITYYACFEIYANIRQLFTGIQVAGPKLTPASVNEGFRAIPAHSSSDPTEPACYYDPGDYTCVKDAVAEWWDPAQQDPGESGYVGCWRAMQGGTRHRANEWPSGDVLAQQNTTSDPCNGYRELSY